MDKLFRGGDFALRYSKFWGQPMQPPIPTQFTPAMSYWEQLEFIFKKIDCFQKDVIHDFHELKNIFYTHEDRIYAALKQYADTQDLLFYAQAQKDLNSLNLELSGELQKLAIRVDAMPSSILAQITPMFGVRDEKIAENKNEIDKLKLDIMDNFDILNRDIIALDNAIVDMSMSLSDKLSVGLENGLQEIREMVSKLQGSQILVINPVTELPSDLNTALKDIWLNPRWGGITAGQYQSLHLTAAEYQNLHISAIEYRDSARWIFFQELYLPTIKPELDGITIQFSELKSYVEESLSMRNPFTGQMDSVKNVVLKLTDFHKPGGLTANEYDGLKVSAQEYQNVNMTAEEYDFNAKEFLT